MNFASLIRDNNKPAIHNWFLFGPILLTIVTGLIFSDPDTLVGLALVNAALCMAGIVLDSRLLRANDVTPPSIWWVLFPLGYWIVRTRRLGTKAFWLGLVLTYAITIVVGALGAMALDSATSETKIAKLACGAATQVFMENSMPNSCVELKLENEYVPNKWRASFVDTRHLTWAAKVEYVSGEGMVYISDIRRK
jgi:hypothetical protein